MTKFRPFTHSRTHGLTHALSLSAIATLATLGAPSSAWAHGAPEYPIGRVYNCYKNPTLPACQAAVTDGGPQALYDWNGVNQGAANSRHQAVVPDGTLCAGGQTKFKGFDLARADWAATPYSPGADGQYELRYHATAPHRTLNFRFYLTRDSYSPTSGALKWSDLDLVAELDPQQIQTSGKTYTMKLNLPRRSGKHVLYSVWQRADSQEAFYGCSDVDFGGVGTTPAVVPSAFKQIGQVAAAQDLPAGSTIQLRVFDKDGADLETTSLTLSAAAAKADWLARIAQQVNATSAWLKVGALQGGAVQVPVGRSVLDVYLTQARPGLNFAMDTRLPAPATGTAVPTAPTKPATGTNSPSTTKPGDTTRPSEGATASWAEGGRYAVGQIVTHQGRRYRCLQAHTAWKGAGWSPDAAGTVHVLWQPL